MLSSRSRLLHSAKNVIRNYAEQSLHKPCIGTENRRLYSVAMTTTRRKLWIDTDAGVDDAQAILMALAQPDVDVIGISTCHGNASAQQAGENILSLLTVANRLDIPVYIGADISVLGCRGNSAFYHGKDGFGDVPGRVKPDCSLLRRDHAVTALIDTAKHNSGDLTLISLAPLTNLALALRMDPTLGRNLQACFIMGGNYQGQGNVTPTAEFNFHTDPEAAYIVLNELTCPITLACWELCLQHALSWEVRSKLRAGLSNKSSFLGQIEEYSVAKSHKLDWPKWLPADELCMATALDPSLVLETISCYVSVETSGSNTRGQMFLDRDDYLRRTSRARIVTKIDDEKYLRLLHRAVE